jgi:predicted helicase
VSRALQEVLDVLDRQHLEREAQGLQRFYDSVRARAAGIEDSAGKQKIVVELYDKFFRTAFPKLADRLGIVYTPVEIVDFILRSADELLRAEFGQTLSSPGVHIIDPFVGTGTFITRLLQSGLIRREDLERKYRHEIHANEIVLLAYYIAAINIEAVYHSEIGGDYIPFEGICLTDTFQLYEQEKDLLSDLMLDNSNRRARQRGLPVRVILTNPPYSVGQGDANANAANIAYPRLDNRVRDTYAARSRATLKNSLYDSYIRAIRWASDRIGEAGVIGFVTNAGWVDGNTADGVRKCLAEEFASVHVFHLRGNQRTSGERSRREGGKIFGQGSRAPIAITLLVKNPQAAYRGRIFFYDIGDYLSREEKLSIIRGFGSLGGIATARKWLTITPDEHGDWLGQRDKSFKAYIPLGDKKGAEPRLFEQYSGGVSSGRDAWVYNPSAKALAANVQKTLAFYNAEVDRFSAAWGHAPRRNRAEVLDNFIDTDPKKISWTAGLKTDLLRGRRHAFTPTAIAQCMYRPFTRSWLYYSRSLNERVLQMPLVFPLDESSAENRVIMVPAPGNVTPFSVLMANTIADLSITAAKSGTQCFPLWVYEEIYSTTDDELNFTENGQMSRRRRHGITEAGLAHFQETYPEESITEDDLFYYVYGLLHSPDYRDRFADTLSKELPRIPPVKRAEDFWRFVAAGRKLADLHCDFDRADPWPVTIAQGALELAYIPDPVKFFRVEKMKFGGKRPNVDRTTVIYNPNITMTGIPLEAYDYVVNGKPALEWVMERQCIKTDPGSGIVSDANAFANEAMGDPAYAFKLFCRIITVSLETMKIVRSLPSLDIRPDTAGSSRAEPERGAVAANWGA